MAIKHIAMWRVKGETEAVRRENCQAIRQVFEGLRHKVPGLLEIEVGIDISRIDYACDVVLYSVFDSEASLASYATHPEHLDAKRKLGDTRTERYQVDYPV
jgi:heme-degrading monooxygenase HmoA